MRISDWSSDVCSSDLGLDDARRVDVEILGEGAQPDAKVRVWRPEQRSAAAVIFEIVDVAADVRTGGAHRIDIAALPAVGARGAEGERVAEDRKSTRLNSSH